MPVCNVKFLIILCFYKYAYIKIQYLRIVINSMGIISPRTEGVNANADYWLTKSVKIPTTVTPGSYSIVVKTNSNTGVNETNATDDIVVRKITIAKAKLITAAPDMISLNLTTGVPTTGQITIGNLGTTDISGIASVIKDASANITFQFNIPAVVGGGNSQVVNYTVTAKDETVLKNKPTVVFKSGTDEAAVTFDITVIPRRPSLVVNPGYLETGILRGQQRIVRCEITNNGGAPANNLAVLMPDVSWIKLVSPQNIGTLAVGAKAGIEISLNPPADMGLGAYTGSFVVSDGANVSLNIGFRITITSDAKGGLKITAKDEFSYFADTHPNVEKATVIVTDMSGNKVAEGVTDATGIFQVQSINEGRYNLEVRADKHGSFHSSIEIVPGVVKEVEAFMQRQLVSYKWSVVPVQIEDKYKVTIEAVFETNVPAPVVTVEFPDILPIIEEKTTTVNMTITNHGLIAANGVNIEFEENQEIYILSSISDVGILPPMTSITVPVKVRAKEDGPIEGSFIPNRTKREGTKASSGCLKGAVTSWVYCNGKKYTSTPINSKYLKGVLYLIKVGEKIYNFFKQYKENGFKSLISLLNTVIDDKSVVDNIIAIANSIYTIGGDFAVCLTIESNILAIVNCLSLVCDLIELNNTISALVSIVPHIDPPECFCAVLSLISFVQKPGVSSGAGTAEKFVKCACNKESKGYNPRYNDNGNGSGGSYVGVYGDFRVTEGDCSH
jgi:uncharacterized membrane protein